VGGGLGVARCVGAGGAWWPVVVWPGVVGVDAPPDEPDEPADPPDAPAAGVVVVWPVVVWVVVVWVCVDVVWVLLLPWPCPEPLGWVPLCFCLVAGPPGVGP